MTKPANGQALLVALFCPPQWGCDEQQAIKAGARGVASLRPLASHTPLADTGASVDAASQPLDSDSLLLTWRKLERVYNAETERLSVLPAALLQLHTQPLLQYLKDADDNAVLEVLTTLQLNPPEPLARFDIEQALRWLIIQYQNRQRFPVKLTAVGFKRFWRPVFAQFVQGSIVSHAADIDDVETSNLAGTAWADEGVESLTVVIWGRQSDATRANLADRNIQLIELEDGFLRSVGLGAEFAKPLSWIADSQTLYFDATMASDLECLINQHKFTNEDKERGRFLRERMVSAGVSKYNTGKALWQRPAQAVTEGKDVVLVTGQVEKDASIRFGAPAGTSNLKLLKRVRELEGDAFIVYKPHPDVVAGARAEGTDENQAFKIADAVVTDVNITQMMKHIDRMHVMTSLAGFEGMLHGVDVVCHGMPFYAGWGLTTDIQTNKRRQATPCLDSLVHAVLIQYPMYVSRDSGYYATAEQALEQLNQWKARGEGNGKAFRKIVRKVMNLVRSSDKG